MIGINNRPNINVQQKCVYSQGNRTFAPVSNISAQKTETPKKIGFLNASKYIAQGFFEQAKGMVTEIFKHPVKTAVTALATTGALFALPLAGIPTAVGGAVLALGFGALGMGKLVYNTSKAVKQNKNGEYDKAKESFKNVGASGVDLALSLPFVPKALKSVKEFAKYGKIGADSALIAEFKNAKGLKSKFNVLNNGNRELARSYNYQSVVDEQLEKFNLSGAQKEAVKKELLDFNVSDDKILDVVLDKLKQRDGYNFDIQLHKQATEKGLNGWYSSKNGNIVVKDFSQPDLPPSARSASKIKRIENFDYENYKATIVDPKTGNQSYELINKKVYDDFCALSKGLKNVSKKGQNVLTLVHEYEHMNQYAMAAMEKGELNYASSQARALNKNIARVKGKLSLSEKLQAVKYRNAALNYDSKNPVRYIENALEKGARNKEMQALQSAQFKRLDSVFKNLSEISNPQYSKIISPAVVQTHNQAV